MTENIKYPVGVETFAEIVEGRYAYVDKTRLVHELVSAGKYFFLSRPRRFGKSLLLSTLESYFEGRRELFEGLWLGQAEGVDWTPRPVLRLNFVSSKADEEDVEAVLDRHLSGWESSLEMHDVKTSLGQRFFNVIEGMYRRSGRKVAVLIDEYDKALANTPADSDRHDSIRNILRPVFSILKDADRYIHFAMLTGVSRFSKLSIFSDLNNLRDISLSDKFCTVCGITQQELVATFSPGIEAIADRYGIGFEEAVALLKNNYDGYHFSENCPDLYNPFSLINAFAENKILHKWFETGTPNFLVGMMQRSDTDIWSILTTEADSTSLASGEMSLPNLTALMYQTGYLTIKGYNAEDDEYLLGVPNREVAQGLFKCLLPRIGINFDRRARNIDSWIIE